MNKEATKDLLIIGFRNNVFVLIVLASLFLTSGCSHPENITAPDIVGCPRGYKEITQGFTTVGCEIDYEHLNYTTINISRKDYEALPMYRQIGWLAGDCYPSNCNMPNPPYCDSYYLTYCASPQEISYYKNLIIKGEENE